MELPHGAGQDIDFMFTKLIVGDLEKTADFYQAVFGLIEMHRVEASIDGAGVSEIIYQPTYQGGPLFILARFHDGRPSKPGEAMLGFAATDIDACLERVEAAGGSILDKPAELPPGVPRYAFVKDPEGHVVQLSQRLG